MARIRKQRKQMAEINVVPYIDVMLVLLVIFLVTAPLLSQGVKVNLPKASARQMMPEKKPPMIVTVNKQGQYFLNVADNPKAPIADDTLQKMVRTAILHNPDRKVYVRGDESASYGDVMQAMVLLQGAGVDTVGLMTDNLPHTSK